MSLRYGRIMDQLQAAGTDDASLSLAIVDIAFHSRSDAEREAIRDALLTASVPRWCEPAFLSALSGRDVPDCQALLNDLSVLEIVERFPARGSSAINVHEATRRVLREHLRNAEPRQFELLSRRAAAYLSEGDSASQRIEYLYHLFAFDPETALRRVEEFAQRCLSLDDLEGLSALSVMLDELQSFKQLNVAAAIETILVQLEWRAARQEISRFEGRVTDVLRQATAIAYASGIYTCHRLLGGIYFSSGRRGAALAVFEECARTAASQISEAPHDELWLRRLAMSYVRIGNASTSQLNSDAAFAAYRKSFEIQLDIASRQSLAKPDTQREFAIVNGRLGRTLEKQGRFGEALEYYRSYLAMARRNTDGEVVSVGWQGSLADAISRMGGVLQAQGDLESAQRLHQENLEISERLYAMDPLNPRLRMLAAAYSRVGDIEEQQEHFDDALVNFEKSLAILRRLSDSDPENLDWLRDVAIAVSRVGFVKVMAGNAADAEAPLQEYLSISRKLEKADPSNAEWRRGLAVALSSVGDLFEDQKRYDDALAAFDEYLAISTALANQDSHNALWQRGLGLAHARVASVHEAKGMFAEAMTHYRDYLAIVSALAEGAREIGEWRRGVAIAHSGIARVHRALHDEPSARTHFALAIAALEKAIERSPNKIRWHADLSDLRQELG